MPYRLLTAVTAAVSAAAAASAAAIAGQEGIVTQIQSFRRAPFPGKCSPEDLTDPFRDVPSLTVLYV